MAHLRLAKDVPSSEGTPRSSTWLDGGSHAGPDVTVSATLGISVVSTRALSGRRRHAKQKQDCLPTEKLGREPAASQVLIIAVSLGYNEHQSR